MISRLFKKAKNGVTLEQLTLARKWFCTTSKNMELYESFRRVGVNKSLIESVEKNEQISDRLDDLWINMSNPQRLVNEKKTANLIIALSSKLIDSLEQEKFNLAEYIINHSISSNSDLDKALRLLKENVMAHGCVDWKLFENSMGIGNSSIDQNEIQQEILETLKTIPNLNAKGLIENKKYASDVIRTLKQKLKHLQNSKIFEILPKVAQILLKEMNENDQLVDQTYGKQEERTHIWDKLPYLKGRDIPNENNSELAHEAHLLARANIPYILRFPPEPNGYLHLGHAKALRTNFQSAKELGGICYLRFDDTNPEKEKIDYINSIIENISWFGFKPFKITYSSDYFDAIHQCALSLIDKDLAYVCELSAQSMAELRERSKEDNLLLFKKMKEGECSENQLTLRAKIDYSNPNPTLRDPVIYRVKKHVHPRTGSAWCIYPTYDFTHCLCDSFENITHSLCSLEFEVRRDLYYWFLHQLGLYKPLVWEYSRLNVSNSVLSKRKLLQLIQHNKVEGWDDPRLLTINALRKRGVRSTAINAFVDLVNVSRHGNENVIDKKLLDHCIRTDLEIDSPRTMAVLDPFHLEITNFMEFENYISAISIPVIPKDPSYGNRIVSVARQILIDASDVREYNPDTISSQEKKQIFFGIYPGSKIALKYVGVIQVIQVDMKNKKVTASITSLEQSDRKSASTSIHWINPNEAIRCTVRLYNDLFTVNDLNTIENILEVVNEKSLEVFEQAFIHKDVLSKFNSANIFQFERLGYFALDPESKSNQQGPLFHRTVTLKDKVNRKLL